MKGISKTNSTSTCNQSNLATAKPEDGWLEFLAIKIWSGSSSQHSQLPVETRQSGRSTFFLPQNNYGKDKWRIASSNRVTAVDGRRNEPRKGDLPIIYVEVESYSYDYLENLSWISSKEMKKRHKFHFDQVPSTTGSPATVPTKVPDRLLGGKSVQWNPPIAIPTTI